MSEYQDDHWENAIREREEALRTAFLAVNISALDELLAPEYIVNSPLQKVFEKRQLFELLKLGRIRHLSFEVDIERISRFGDVAVVMGRDQVTDPPEGKLTHRRFTNIWQLTEGVWRSIARHANSVG
ncbi:MAG TPA: nuclear transport factor 2 family protein [Pseudomonadales bacterium]|nr:nuclear transport factor 2 family protein [Pseudomonadales bacterium]